MKRVWRTGLILGAVVLFGCTGPRPVGATCALNSECASGLVCAGGQCRTECVMDRDCPSGAMCLPSGQGVSRVCLRPTEPRLCQYASDCTAPQICSPTGRCTFQCATDYDCTVFGNAGARCILVGDGGQGGTCSNNPVFRDAGSDAATALDAGRDAAIATFDAGRDAGADAGTALDAAVTDAGEDAALDMGTDAGPPGDAGPLELETAFAGCECAGDYGIDDCPAGEYVVGLRAGPSTNGFYQSALTQLTIQCASVTISGTGASRTVTVANTVSLPATGFRGTTAAIAPTAITCGANEVLVGLSGTSTSVNLPPLIPVPRTYTLRCAPLTADATGALVVGAAVARGSVGSPTATMVGPVDCPAGRLPRGVRVNSGEVLAGIALRCVPTGL